MYGLAAGLIVAVLGVVVVRQFNRPSATDLQPVTPVTTAPEAAPPDPVMPSADSTAPGPTVTVALAGPESPTELSEADLIAVDTRAIQQEVAGRAEWLVLEFFTLDPSDPWRDRVETASGLRLPSDLVPDTSEGPTVSYVEWTHTQSVEQTDQDTFRATVLIRRMVAPDGVTFQRLPAEWVDVHLRVEPDGNVRATSLPDITTPPTDSLVPLRKDGLVWVTDAAGIGWPSTRP